MNPNAKKIEWENPLTVEYAVKNRELLDSLIFENPGIVLDFSAVPKVDITGVQLIIAAYEESIRRGKVFDVTGSFNAVVAETILQCGITPQNWSSWKEYFFKKNTPVSTEAVHE